MATETQTDQNNHTGSVTLYDDSHVRLVRRLDGSIAMGCLDQKGMDLMSSQADLGRYEGAEVRRLPDGEVYLVIFGGR